MTKDVIECTKFWAGVPSSRSEQFALGNNSTKHNMRSNLSVQDIKSTIDSKLPFSMLCIIGYKSFPICEMLSWHQDNQSISYSISHYCTKKTKHNNSNKRFHLKKKRGGIGIPSFFKMFLELLKILHLQNSW